MELDDTIIQGIPDRTVMGQPGPGSTYDNSQADADLLWFMNQARAGAQLEPLVQHPALSQAAVGHAQDMADHNKCDHYTFADHSTWADRCRAAGYPGADLAHIGENVAGGQTDAGQAFSDWMGSRGHRAAIMNPEARHVGSAAATGTGGWTYWCTDLGWGAPDPTPPPPPPPPTPPDLDYYLI